MTFLCLDQAVARAIEMRAFGLSPPTLPMQELQRKTPARRVRKNPLQLQHHGHYCDSNDSTHQEAANSENALRHRISSESRRWLFVVIVVGFRRARDVAKLAAEKHHQESFSKYSPSRNPTRYPRSATTSCLWHWCVSHGYPQMCLGRARVSCCCAPLGAYSSAGGSNSPAVPAAADAVPTARR